MVREKEMMVTMIQAVDEVKDAFEYTPDETRHGKRDSWYIMKQKPYKGDCEDFSLTVLYKLCGENLFALLMQLLFGSAKLHYTTYYGVGHAVLEYRGMFTDNIQQKWVSKKELLADGYIFPVRFAYLWGESYWKLFRGYLNARKNSKKEKQGNS